MNMASLVGAHRADARALYDRGAWITWGTLRRRAAQLSAALGDRGVSPDDRVVIVWPTAAEFVVAYLGVLGAGAVAVPLNPHSPPAELAREIAAVEPVLVIDEESAAQFAGLSSSDDDKARGASGDEPFTAVDREDAELAVLLFTSGTAGDPRAAMLTHGNLLANVHQMQAIPEILGADDVGLAAVPLFHVFGLNVVLGLSLATGAALVLAERFDPTSTLKQVGELGVTTLLGVPTMFAAWADLPDADAAGGALVGVRRAISGAAALDPDVARRFERRYGVAVWQGYGLTEASPAVSTSLGTGRNRAGSVGPPLPGVELRLVDDSGDEVLAGDPGEIWVRGRNVFAGYWRDPDATARVVTTDGWLRTGDVGVIGEDGDLFVVDRAKDLVIVSGFNVFPAEVERVVAGVPGVAEVVVVGKPDAVTGEALEAVIVADPGATVTEALVQAHCSTNLARYKCPSSIRFVDELPHGLSGKALRRALRGDAA